MKYQNIASCKFFSEMFSPNALLWTVHLYHIFAWKSFLQNKYNIHQGHHAIDPSDCGKTVQNFVTSQCFYLGQTSFEPRSNIENALWRHEISKIFPAFGRVNFRPITMHYVGVHDVILVLPCKLHRSNIGHGISKLLNKLNFLAIY